ELPKLKAWLLDESVAPFQLWLTDQVNALCNNTEPTQPELNRPIAMHMPGSGRNRKALVAAEATFLGLMSAQDTNTNLEGQEEQEEEEEEQSEESEELWVQLELLDFSVQPIQLPRPPQPRASRSQNPVLPTVQERPKFTKR
ncbi:unnamed protein product, partial [Polarella glacialis]